MTEIKVERRRPGVWPWVLGLTVLALVIWGLTELLGGDDDAAEKVMEAPVPPAGGGAAALAFLPVRRVALKYHAVPDVPHATIPDGRGLS